MCNQAAWFGEAYCIERLAFGDEAFVRFPRSDMEALPAFDSLDRMTNLLAPCKLV